MMLVPRSQERTITTTSSLSASTSVSIALNSVAFAGSILVKNEEEKKKVQEIGPLNLLKLVTKPNIEEEKT